MRYFSVSVAALAVQGCGGGGSSETASATPAAPVAPVASNPTPVTIAPTLPPTLPPTVAEAPPAPAPVWLPVPALIFTQGVASSISIVDYVSVANTNAFSVSLNATPLPSGVTFNSTTRAFDYDGRGNMATSEGHVLTAAVL